MMSHPAIAATIAVIAWWVATGVVIVIARKGGSRHGLTMILMTLSAAIAVVVMLTTANMTSTAAAYAGFASALVIWAWHEVAFLLGIITGPRVSIMDSEATGLRRFRMAFDTIRDHEVALFATMMAIIWVLHGAENHAALWSFVLLWVMRVSTKLNIFLGAPNAVSDLLPERLDYLKSYFRTDRTNPMFSVSLAFAALVFALCVFHATVATTDAQLVSWSILAAFAALGLLEHLFLVLPFRDADMWHFLVPERTALQTAVADGAETTKTPTNTMGSAGAQP